MIVPAALIALGLGLAVSAQPARACDAALVLAIDVSGSVDVGEYRLQIGGIASALEDPAIAEALISGQIALSVMQWSGAGQQEISLPWRRMLSADEVGRFAASARALPRAFTGSDTAPGDALLTALEQFAAVSDCGRRIIDMSGDGPQNSGSSTGSARSLAHRSGVAINGIAIEDMGAGVSTTEFYRRFVITPGGFVMTARGHRDYASTLRAKILRELARPTG